MGLFRSGMKAHFALLSILSVPVRALAKSRSGRPAPGTLQGKKRYVAPQLRKHHLSPSIGPAFVLKGKGKRLDDVMMAVNT